MILVDLSVWELFFAEQARVGLAELVRPEEISICPTIYLRLLSRISRADAREEISYSLKNFVFLEKTMSTEYMDQSIALQHHPEIRSKKKRLSLEESLIATAAIRNGHILLHRNKNYELIPHVTGIQSYYLR